MSKIADKVIGFFSSKLNESNTVEINDHGKGASNATNFLVKFAAGLALASAMVMAGAPNADAAGLDTAQQSDHGSLEYHKANNTDKYKEFLAWVASQENQPSQASQQHEKVVQFNVSGTVDKYGNVVGLEVTGTPPSGVCEAYADVDSPKKLNDLVNKELRDAGQSIHGPLRSAAYNNAALLVAACDKADNANDSPQEGRGANYTVSSNGGVNLGF